MSWNSYIIPASQWTPADARAMRAVCEAGLKARLPGVADDNLVIRDALMVTDFPTSFAANQWWATPALVVNTLATLVNQLLPANKALAVYGCFNLTPIGTVTQLYLRQGGAAGSPIGFVSLDSIYSQLEAIGYFSSPVFYKPNDTMFVQVIPRATVAGGELFGLKVLVAEASGPVVSPPAP